LRFGQAGRHRLAAGTTEQDVRVINVRFIKVLIARLHREGPEQNHRNEPLRIRCVTGRRKEDKVMLVRSLLEHKRLEFHPIAADTTVAQAIADMHHWRLDALVVLDEKGRLQGVLSKREVIAGLYEEEGMILAREVSDLMVPVPVSCTPEDSLEDAVLLMVGHEVRHLPIIEAGQVVGLIGVNDLMTAQLREQNDEARKFLTLSRFLPRPGWGMERTAGLV